jgi:fatty-acyl-CoA synthase
VPAHATSVAFRGGVCAVGTATLDGRGALIAFFSTVATSRSGTTYPAKDRAVNLTPTSFNVGSWIERRARIAPQRTALVSSTRSLTYAELAARIRRLANGLRALGVGHGDRVAWLGPNDTAFLELLFAAGLLGAALAPVNHRLASDERAFVLEDTEPCVLIQHQAMGLITVPSAVQHRIAVGGSLVGARDYESLIAMSPDDPIDEAVGLDDLLLLPHTSGTTGNPKGVMLSHGNVTWNVVNFLTCADFRGDDVTVAIAPFFRVGGTGVNVLPVMFMGGTVIVPDDSEADTILRLIEQHRVTVGFGNPDLLEGLSRSERWQAVDLSSLRFVITGGAPVPERLIRLYLKRGVTLLQGYGLSEAAPFVLLLDPRNALHKVGSAGRPPLLVDIRIARPDGADVPSGETGELLVRGPNVMAGYWRRPSETRQALMPDGWLRTGDAARIDEDGDVWIVDRVDASFESAGEVVYPGDVERVLMDHPSVADAAVVGIAGPDGRSNGAAFVVRSPAARLTEADVLAFVRERLAPHQLPASVTFVEDLPRNSVGKLLRERLRARLEDGPP